MPLPAIDSAGRYSEQVGAAGANDPVAGAGTVIANAAALTYGFTVVTGGDDTVGVRLPTAYAGATVEVYNQDANGAHGLKVYPPVNSAINNGTANASVVIEGWTLARFRGLSATNWGASYTVNT